jgi:hypothetical protein
MDNWNIIPVPYKLWMWNLHRKRNRRGCACDNAIVCLLLYRFPVTCLRGMNSTSQLYIIQNNSRLTTHTGKRMHLEKYHWTGKMRWFSNCDTQHLRIIKYQILWNFKDTAKELKFFYKNAHSKCWKISNLWETYKTVQKFRIWGNCKSEKIHNKFKKFYSLTVTESEKHAVTCISD